MAIITITELPIATSAGNADVFPFVASGVTSQINAFNLAKSLELFPYTGSAGVSGSIPLVGSLSIQTLDSQNTTLASMNVSKFVFTVGANGIPQLGIGTPTPSAAINILGSTAAENLLRIQSGSGTDLLFVSSSGNIGIGTVNPTAKLHISGSTNRETLLHVQNNSGINALFVSSSGNVGMSTSSPNKTGFDDNARVLTVFGPNRAVLELGSENAVNNDFVGAITFNSGSIRKSQITSTINGNGSGSLSFTVGSLSLGAPDIARIFISASGNVGINTTTPNAKLEISGGAAITTLVNSYTNAGILHQYNSSNVLAIGSNGTSMLLQGVNATNNTAKNIIINPLGGNVGIGHTNPLYALHVSGSASTVAIVGESVDSTIFSNLWNETPTVYVVNRSANSGLVGGGTGIKFSCSSTANPLSGILALKESNTQSKISIWTQDSNGSVLERLVVESAGNTRPAADNTYDIGTASYRWNDVYATNTTIQTSDLREKKDVFDSDLGLDFISKLRPISYKWKVSKNQVVGKIITDDKGKPVLDENGNEKTENITTAIEGKRTHYGLIAQEVKTVLGDKDFAGFIHNQETDMMGLRYSEFISPMIKAIQELKAQVESLKSEIQILKGN